MIFAVLDVLRTAYRLQFFYIYFEHKLNEKQVQWQR